MLFLIVDIIVNKFDVDTNSCKSIEWKEEMDELNDIDITQTT